MCVHNTCSKHQWIIQSPVSFPLLNFLFSDSTDALIQARLVVGWSMGVVVLESRFGSNFDLYILNFLFTLSRLSLVYSLPSLSSSFDDISFIERREKDKADHGEKEIQTLVSGVGVKVSGVD
ncbi:hypothetical protein L1887_12718 [Cichorium endivia]|nr:hypothetical protein L1887_12718 [Cichorium endivia]